MYILKTLLILATLVISNAYADKEKPAPKITPLPEVSIGSAKAPVKMYIYTCLTCSHCAHFHTKVLPKIEAKYVKPGYVYIVFRDFPGNKTSLQAHQVSWCKGGVHHLQLMQAFYLAQDKWLNAKDPIIELKKIAAKNGVSKEEFEAAIKNQDLLDKIIQVRLEGQKKYKITATPTCIINAIIYPRALTFEELDDIFKPLLKPVKKAEKKKS